MTDFLAVVLVALTQLGVLLFALTGITAAVILPITVAVITGINTVTRRRRRHASPDTTWLNLRDKVSQQ